MRLSDLEPEWVHDFGKVPAEELGIENAQGVFFLCPVCFKRNGGPVGTHGIIAYFRHRGVPADARPGPGRWTPTGTGLADLTLNPSIDLTKSFPNEWHGWVRNGMIEGGI